MADNSGKLITVFGGSGFVGRHVVRALAKRGYRVRVACRRPDLAFALQAARQCRADFRSSRPMCATARRLIALWRAQTMWSTL